MLLLWVCTVLFKEAVYPERRWDRCLDLGLRRWWGLLTAVRVKKQVWSQGSEGTGEGSLAQEWGFLGGEDQKARMS